ncbi:hypothetical protein EVAR_77440_1 [Eumeta japonica]|uniref:Uncharacterized protein n=1 Tax=Eumeta variegata TaxID=151549 RepID=A0A4C1YYV3_EUMVA|nr:hypothetical protein EVAR_77440_1 [Eumeta japonica]
MSYKFYVSSINFTFVKDKDRRFRTRPALDLDKGPALGTFPIKLASVTPYAIISYAIASFSYETILAPAPGPDPSPASHSDPEAVLKPDPFTDTVVTNNQSAR